MGVQVVIWVVIWWTDGQMGSNTRGSVKTTRVADTWLSIFCLEAEQRNQLMIDSRKYVLSVVKNWA